jgi:hypothetical protein
MIDLRRILKEREAFYAKADVVFSTSGKDLTQVVAGLHEQLKPE